MTKQKVIMIADKVKKNDSGTVVSLHYSAIGGDNTVTLVPFNSLTTFKIKEGEWLCKVSEFETPGGVFRPEMVFKGEREPVQPSSELHIDLIDMVEQGAAEQNLTARINDTPTPELAEGIEFAKIWEAEEVDSSADVWDGALLKGGRAKKTAPWNFTPEFLPNFVFSGEEFVRVNKPNGSAATWSIFNPALKTENRPAGALLGSVSDRYHVLPHPQWVEPMLRYAEMSNINSSVVAWNDGARCRVDLDVTQAAQTRKAAAAQLKEKGHNFLSLDAFSEAAQNLDGLYKFGFTINNSLDGRGSFSVHGGALRTYCSNLAVAGGIKTALSLRHTKGVMADIDWDELGLDLVNATAELNEWLVNTELLSWVPMDIQLMDKLMYVMSENNIGLSPPRITKDKETQEVKNVNRSHMDLALAQGWKDPNLYYVKAADEKNTAYHALQCFTGAITHKPTVFDDKRKLDGTALGMDTLDGRLKRVNDEFMKMFNWVTSEYEGADMSLEDKESFRDLIRKENLVEAYLDGIPGYTEVHGISAL